MVNERPRTFVVLVEDVSGKGHLSKAVGGRMRRSIFVPVD